ncbi:hypothetical protein [Streptomyces blattellae]|uniref:hypothetical protein n=1 Tax=Streptomyces blattellae TaxID=2569855 RepID=UPI001E4918D2|nr:hypothetical protein [Streptomyces blattellae]
MNTYAGFRPVTDILVGWDGTNEPEVISAEEHFVRGIKLTLASGPNYPAASSELTTISGVSDAKVWTPAGMKAESDLANA